MCLFGNRVWSWSERDFLENGRGQRERERKLFNYEHSIRISSNPIGTHILLVQLEEFIIDEPNCEFFFVHAQHDKQNRMYVCMCVCAENCLQFNLQHKMPIDSDSAPIFVWYSLSIQGSANLRLYCPWKKRKQWRCNWSNWLLRSILFDGCVCFPVFRVS